VPLNESIAYPAPLSKSILPWDLSVLDPTRLPLSFIRLLEVIFMLVHVIFQAKVVEHNTGVDYTAHCGGVVQKYPFLRKAVPDTLEETEALGCARNELSSKSYGAQSSNDATW